MRCSKAVLLLIAAVFLMVSTIPATAWDGGGRWEDQIEIEEDHPWQDDNEGPNGGDRVRPPIVIALPVAVTITLDLPSFLTRLFYDNHQTSTKVRTIAPKRQRINNNSNFVTRRSDLI